MAMGKMPGERQEELFIAASAVGALDNPFYAALDKLLRKSGFDEFAEETCREFYAARMGRPGLPPGGYFRMLMAGYLEGIGSERGIAWRCRDSISLREFLGYGLAKTPPEHSTLSKTRKRLSLEAHGAVFGWVLERLQESGLLRGKTVGVDSTTLEANAAMRAIVRRDEGTEYDAWLEQLAEASGIETPTRQDLAKMDRKRPKKGSNKDWKHPHDPEARITKMKDGRTRRKWKGKRDAQQAVYGNRRRIKGERGKRLLRERGEKLERTFAHLLGSGGLRRVHVRGQEEIRKRMLVHAAAFNLSLVMRTCFGFGTPRGLQGLAAAAAALADASARSLAAIFLAISGAFSASRAHRSAPSAAQAA